MSEATDSTLDHANENEEFRTHMEWLLLVDEPMYNRVRTTAIAVSLCDLVFLVVGIVAMMDTNDDERAASWPPWSHLRSADQTVSIIAGPCLTFFSALCIFRGEYIPMCLPKELTTSRAAMAAAVILEVYVVYTSFNLWMGEDVGLLGAMDHVVCVFSILILAARLLFCCRIMSAHATEKMGKEALRKRASAVHFMRDVEDGVAGDACSGYSDEELVEAADKIQGLEAAEEPVSAAAVAAATQAAPGPGSGPAASGDRAVGSWTTDADGAKPGDPPAGWNGKTVSAQDLDEL